MGNADTTSLLLQAGAHVDVADREGKRPLIVTIMKLIEDALAKRQAITQPSKP